MARSLRSLHHPVLVQSVLRYIRVRPNGNYIDGTVGGGGHAAAILERSAPHGMLLGVDADPAAIFLARRTLRKFGSRVILAQGSYAHIHSLRMQCNFTHDVHGIILDLGYSSDQIQDRDRGFSFEHPGVLDMRFNTKEGRTANDILHTSSEAELTRIFQEYGEITYARRLARNLVHTRKTHAITGKVLVEVVQRSRDRRFRSLHPATHIFQALRIAVNNELETLYNGLRMSHSELFARGRLVVISFHSLEDRMVKNFFREYSGRCTCPPTSPLCTCGQRPQLKILTKSAITPSGDEIQLNPRSRSAKLRAAEKI